VIINSIFYLNNGAITSYSDFFNNTGEIADSDFKSKYGITNSLILKVVDDLVDPSIIHNVTCNAKDKGNNQYEFICTPAKGVKGTIFYQLLLIKITMLYF
jgi:hypothetical protein